jgi:hypothetical protein
MGFAAPRAAAMISAGVFMPPTAEALARGIGGVRRRARVTLVASGAAWLIVAAGGLILAATLLDRAVHLDSPAARLALLVAVLGATTLVCWRYLISPFVFPISDAALAMKIEERFPRFREGLASSLQFLKTDCDPALGSPELQRQAIEETVGLARSIDMTEAVQFAPPRPVLGAAAGVLLLVVVFVCVTCRFSLRRSIRKPTRPSKSCAAASSIS